MANVVTEFVEDTYNEMKGLAEKTHRETISLLKEIKEECLQVDVVKDYSWSFISTFHTWFYLPFLPALHRPGWMLRYFVGPFNIEWAESFFSDFWAGITVALTLIPQGLSYAKLANLPPINGLYTAVLPSVFYTLLGSSMQLGVGPVALVSLLMGQLVIQYDVVAGSQDSVDLAGECALCVGLFLTVMSVLRLGTFIRYISHPVMSGFTTAAAMLIGLNQLKNAFGFTSAVPQQGQVGYDYNYQVMHWFVDHWWDHNHVVRTYKNGVIVPLKLSQYGVDGTTTRDHYVTAICWGFFIPLLAIQIFKNSYKPSEERKKTISFRIWNIASSLAPFISIIIGARIAYLIHKHDHFTNPNVIHHYYSKNLKIVGPVAAGINIIRAPSLKWSFGKLMGDVFPLTLIAFMESYSVAHRLASLRNELHILNANQEMFSIGVANFMASISSAYPVAGSFSRSSLNAAAGARTPLSKAVTMVVIVLCLRFLTTTFQYIPQAVLSSVIWVAIYNLVSVTDFWHAWKHSKKDFFVMLVTAVIVFVFDTGIGLAAGLGCSVVLLIGEMAFAPQYKPQLASTSDKNDPERIDVVVLKNDLNFISGGQFTDYVQALTVLEPSAPTNANRSDEIYFQVTSFLDRYLSPVVLNPVNVVPKAVIIDFINVRIIDLTAMLILEDMARTTRLNGSKFIMINVTDDIAASFAKFHIGNDHPDANGALDKYLALSTLPFIKVKEEGGVVAVKDVDHKYDSIEAGEGSGTDEGLELGYAEVAVEDHQSKTVNVNAI